MSETDSNTLTITSVNHSGRRVTEVIELPPKKNLPTEVPLWFDELTLELASKCWLFESLDEGERVCTPFGDLAYKNEEAWSTHTVSDYWQEAVFLLAALEQPSLWQIAETDSAGVKTVTTPFGVLTVRQDQEVTVELLRQDGFVCLVIEDTAKRERRQKDKLMDWRASKRRMEFMTRR